MARPGVPLGEGDRRLAGVEDVLAPRELERNLAGAGPIGTFPDPLDPSFG